MWSPPLAAITARVARALRDIRQPPQVIQAPPLPSAILTLFLAFRALPGPSVFLAWAPWAGFRAGSERGGLSCSMAPRLPGGIWSTRGPSQVPWGSAG